MRFLPSVPHKGIAPASTPPLLTRYSPSCKMLRSTTSPDPFLLLRASRMLDCACSRGAFFIFLSGYCDVASLACLRSSSTWLKSYVCVSDECRRGNTAQDGRKQAKHTAARKASAQTAEEGRPRKAWLEDLQAYMLPWYGNVSSAVRPFMCYVTIATMHVGLTCTSNQPVTMAAHRGGGEGSRGQRHGGTPARGVSLASLVYVCLQTSDLLIITYM